MLILVEIKYKPSIIEVFNILLLWVVKHREGEHTVMRLFVPDEPDTVENNIQYRALGRSFYRCLKEFDLADLHSQVHDEAVDLL